jgi:ABC-2 type transport system ATP-binding protein
MLDLQEVSKRYGATLAVSHLNFTVKPGEVLGYLGPNGSGKSTTVKMVVGLAQPNTGRILFDGTDIRQNLTAYKALVGYVPEEAHLYTYLTGPEYLRLVGRMRGLSERVLSAKIDRFLRIFGLDVDRHARLAAFSKGMRQKILISAALLHNPKVIVLDEPASGLDVSTALVLRTLVRALAAAGRIVFYSSHELETVERVSTRVIILSAGRVVGDGSAGELRRLMNLPSLEDVFSQLAVRENLDQLAAELYDTITT